MPHRRAVLKSVALLPLAGWAASHAPAFAAPPLAGHFTHASVRLWLQATGEASGHVEYWPAAAAEADAKRAGFKLPDARGHGGIVEITGLAPGTAYRFRAAIEGGGARTGRFRTAPAPGAVPGDFRVYLGSCAYTETHTRGGNPYGSNHHIFDTMASRMDEDALPHFMLWLGDNLYLRGPSKGAGIPGEYSTVALMEERYRSVRSMLKLSRLFAATHHYAIWDDHDYGPNDSDKSFVLKADALRLFEGYWPNPPRDAGDPPGTWRRFVHQDAEFFLLDGRYQRDAQLAPQSEDKAMFGAAQMEWLRRGLAASRARFKIVASGSQLLSEGENGKTSGWHSYPAERGAFLGWLEREAIPGVVFLSGDRHNTQLYRHERKGAGAIHEFSCSPLTSKVVALNAADRANARLDAGTAVETQNFGTLEFAGEGRARKLVARCFDADGKLLWTRELA